MHSKLINYEIRINLFTWSFKWVHCVRKYMHLQQFKLFSPNAVILVHTYYLNGHSSVLDIPALNFLAKYRCFI